MGAARPTVHATAVLIGSRAVLIRGAARSGKSRLALSLLKAAEQGTVRFARLVADDRCRLEAANGRLLVRPSSELAGLLEIRGVGLQRLPYEPVAVVGLVVDLAAPDAERLPSAASRTIEIEGVSLPRLAVTSSVLEPLPLVLASLEEQIPVD